MASIDASHHFEHVLPALLVQAVSQLANAVFITDEAGKIIWVNDAFCQLSGYGASELIGRTAAMLKSGRQGQAFDAQLWQTILGGKPWHGEVTDQRKDGSLYTVDEIITPLRDADGAIRHFVAVQQDITQRQREHEQERYLAYHDQLTGLPNRAMLRDIHARAISTALRTQQLLATMFLDLDGFKAVNDKLGHYAGDQLLAAVAQRLQGAIRQADTIARVGGDEFAVLMTAIGDPSAAEALARKLLDTLSRPFVLRGQQFSIHVSIGIALFPGDGADGTILLDHADKAMYQVKLQGGNDFQFYQQSFSRGEGGARMTPPLTRH